MLRQVRLPESSKAAVLWVRAAATGVGERTSDCAGRNGDRRQDLTGDLLPSGHQPGRRGDQSLELADAYTASVSRHAGSRAGRR